MTTSFEFTKKPSASSFGSQHLLPWLGAMSILSTTMMLPGCIVERDDPPIAAAPPVTSDQGTTNITTQPMVVVIDTNESMKATPGDGVGIYVEYKEGGQWTLRATCDTRLSGASCSNTIRVKGSTLTYADSSGTTTTSSSFEANILVRLDSPALSFTAEPGKPVTVEASIDGVAKGDGQFFFFVQDQKVNGGFQGKLSNPLTFLPSRP
jgi:hypothetical protein